MTLERNIYRFVIGLLIVYILYHQGCVDRPCPDSKPPAIEKIVRDTILKPVLEFVPRYVPKVDEVIIYRDTSFKPIEAFETTIREDTPYSLGNYSEAVIYNDTAKIEYGKIIIKDTLSHNRITGRSLIADLNIPTVKETVTVQPKKKLQLYAGITAVGNQQTFIDGFGGFLTLKTKNDQLYQVGGLLMNNRLNVQASMSFLIRLKK